jgi:putative serine protease PepD
MPIVTDVSAWRTPEDREPPRAAYRSQPAAKPYESPAPAASDWSSSGWSGPTWSPSSAPGSPSAIPADDPTPQHGVWWSDARHDPWRDPHAPSAVVIRSPSASEPASMMSAAATGTGMPTRLPLRQVLLISVVTALLAGALGGAIGYLAAGRATNRTLGGGDGSTAALATRPPDSLAGVVAKVQPSVVTIKITTDGGYSLGSGFIISSDGYVITNDHVITGGSGPAEITFSDASTSSATLVGTDPESDVAVLKLARTGLPAVTFGDSDRVAVGDPVLAFGSPLALDNTVTYGIVSAVNRPIEAGDPGGPARYYAAIQTDAAINHGNSGGPLVDAGGRVIGVDAVIKSTASDSQDAGNIGLAFAIPINQAKRVAADIIELGHARRTVIGAQVNNAYQSPAGGVSLSSVVSGGPAANGGLRPGDVVMKVDGIALADPSDLVAIIRKYDPGSRVAIVYLRNGAAHSTVVTLVADSG